MFSITILGILLFSVLTGCGQIQKYEIPYTADSEVSSFRVIEFTNEKNTADPFAKDLCVSESNYRADAIDLSNASGGALFDVNNHETIYAKNIYEKLAPASLTKILTAVVALKNASEDTLLTATSNVKITESGAQVCGLKEGDQLTLSQALHLLLINSANDAAVLIAEGVGGSVENFCEMMNEEALALGATNSHFVNPHGLTDDNHYTTVYDMYLIMNEAIKFEVFREIIHMDSYTTVYHDRNGAEKEITVNSTPIRNTAPSATGTLICCPSTRLNAVNAVREMAQPIANGRLAHRPITIEPSPATRQVATKTAAGGKPALPNMPGTTITE